MGFLKKNIFAGMLILLLLLLLYVFFVLMNPRIIKNTISKTYHKDFVYEVNPALNSASPLPALVLSKKLENPPTILKVAYATGWSTGSKKYIAYLDNLIATTQINAMVIDVKDASGIVSYATNAKMAKEFKAYFPEISDINELVNHLHSKGIYVIGRIVVFEDPALAKNRPDLAVYDKSKTQDPVHPVLWEDNNKLSWVDPASQEVYDYNIEIAKDAVSHGFDEINFDYVRFPTDGNSDTMGFPVWNKEIPKNFVIKNFFKKLRQALPDTKISADLFGQTTTNTDDMGIGQIWEDALPYFDYICPMVYPSHYINGFLGYQNPADHPYQIVKYAIDSALARQQVQVKISTSTIALAKIRPWLQDFNMGATYDAVMVQEEIKAVQDAMGSEFSGYMLWSPSNIYTSDALLK